MTAQHTPTPYSVDDNPRRTRVRILNADSAWTATIEIASANTQEAKDTAAFIVRACNAHDDLVAALRVVDCRCAAASGRFAAITCIRCAALAKAGAA